MKNPIKMTNSFQKHPSETLISLYRERNFQGANPRHAKILFIGKDPNWAINVEELSIFNLVNEYLTDGVEFWKKYDIHHPFLHPKYSGDGKKYHNAVSRINIKSDLANEISFIELIGFPTTGMSSLNHKRFNEYLLSSDNRKHLLELNELLNDSGKIIFLFWGMINYIKLLNRKTGLFEKFANLDKKTMNKTSLNKFDNLYFHKHFSMGISQETLNKIAIEITNKFN